MGLGREVDVGESDWALAWLIFALFSAFAPSFDHLRTPIIMLSIQIT